MERLLLLPQNQPVGSLILAAGLLMAAALAASLLAGRLRVPGLVLFLVIGMAVGSDGLGWVAFDDYALARDVGIVALALIIIEGGLGTRVDDVRPVLGSALSLSILGTLVTAIPERCSDVVFVQWKTKLPGRRTSSPVVWEQRLLFPSDAAPRGRDDNHEKQKHRHPHKTQIPRSEDYLARRRRVASRTAHRRHP